MKTTQYRLSLDTAGFRRSATQADKQLKDIGNTARKEGENVSMFSNKLKAGIAGALSVTAVVAFAKSLTNVRAEMAQLEVAIATFLGSKERADALIRDVQTFAVTTPFSLSETTQATQALLGFGIEADKIGTTLEQLGNVASGTGNSLNDLVAPFGRIIATGRVSTRELETFARRGVPIFDELAAVLGVTSEEVGKLATESALTSQNIISAFEHMSAAGGKYAGLMDTLKTEIVGLQDELSGGIEELQLEYGKKLEPAIKGVYKAGISLVDNFEEIARTVGGLIVAVGSYKAALAVVTALERANITVMRQAVLEKQLAIKWGRTLTNQQAIQIAQNKLLGQGFISLRRSVKALWGTLAANPYALLAAGIAAAAYGIFKLVTAEDAAIRSAREYRESVRELNQAKDDRIAKANELISITQDSARADIVRINAMDNLKDAYREIIQKYINEEGHLKNILGLKKEIAEFEETAAAKERDARLLEAEATIAEAEKKLASSGLYGQIKWGKRYSEAVGVRDAILEEKSKEQASAAFSEWQVALKGQSEAQLQNIIKRFDEMLETSTEANKEAIKERIAIVNAEIRSRQAEEIKKNYAYWEELEAGYVAELKTLEADGERGERWEELAGKIAYAREQLDKYSLKTDKAKEKEALDLSEQIAQKRHDIAKVGLEDRLKLNGLELQRELEQLERNLKNKIYSEEEYSELKLLTNQLYSERASLITKDEEEKERKELEGLLESFKTKEQQMLEVKERYAKLRVKAEEDGRYSVEAVNKAEAEAISEIMRSAFDIDALSLFGNLDRLTTDALKRIRDSLKEQIRQAEGVLSPTDMKALVDVYEDFNSKVVERRPFEQLSDTVKEYSKAIADVKGAQGALSSAKQIGDLEKIADAEEEVVRALERRANAQFNLNLVITQGASYLQDIVGVGNALTSLLSDFGVKVPKELSDVLGGFSQFASSLGSIDPNNPFSIISSSIGAIAGIGKAVSSVVKGIAGIFGSGRRARRENERMLELLRKQSEELDRQYALSKARAEIEKSNTIFGSDSWAQMRKTANLYAQLNKEAMTSLKALSEGEVVTGTYVSKSFWRSKRKDRWEGLLDAFPELVKANGMLNVELAESILKTHKLKDDGKELLENAIRDAKELESALADIRGNLNTLFGSLGDNITDSFISAFKTGEDAMESMYASAGDMIEGLAKQILSSFIFTRYLQSAVDEIEKIALNTGLSDKEAFSMFSEALGGALGGLMGAGDEINDLLTWFQEEARRYGLEVFSNADEVSKAFDSGYQTLSEDTGQLLEGRANAILTYVGQIKGGFDGVATKMVDVVGFNKMTATNTLELRNISLNAVGYLDRIAKGTDNLHEIRRDIKDLQTVVRDRL